MTTATTRIHPPGDGERPDRAHPSRMLRVGTVLWNRYEITAVMGATKLGEVWRCTDRQTGKEVILRQLSADMRRSKQAMALIHMGIRRISHQSHPHLAVTRQMVYMGDEIYLIGDFAPGVDIGTWGRVGVDHNRTVAEVLPKLQQVAAALDFAHAAQVVHRDVKPSNIYLASDGVVRVTDFCLAPLHHMAIVRGQALRVGDTGPYLAPEIQQGGEPDAASDQYALAVLAWELLTGAPPAPEKTGEPPEDLPRAARAALRRALAPKPRNRFLTCGDFVKALGGEAVSGRRRGRSPTEWRRIRRHASLAASLLVVGGGLWGGIRTALWWVNRPKPPPEILPVMPVKMPEKKKTEEAVRPVVTPLVATTPLPEEGKPWVAHSVPMQFVWVPPMQMWVGRFEVANEEYLRKDPAHSSGDFHGTTLAGPRQPVVRVNFDDCVAYAAWLTEQERAVGKLAAGWRYRLPSRMEAVAYTRAGFSEMNFPWGERWPPARGNYADFEFGKTFSDLPTIPEYQDGFAVTAPVEFSSENPWGLFGAGGNVWETTSKEPGGAVFGGWQGGGFDDYLPARLKSDTFYGFLGNARGAVNGFRLVLAPISGETPAPAPAAPAAPAAGE